MPTTTADVRDFLAQRRIAMVGVSRDPKDFSRMLFRDLCSRGYDIVAVNPATQEIEGRACFATVEQIQPVADAALLMTPSSETTNVVRACAAAGINRIWMYRAGGRGAVSQDAVQFCRENGLRLIEGHCPYMFLPGAPFVHRVHGLVLKVFGGYPKNAAA